MKCTATLTTQRVTGEEVAFVGSREETYLWEVPDGVQVKRADDRLVRVDTHEATCGLALEDHGDTAPVRHASEDQRIVWYDDWPGASPHHDPDPCPDCDGAALDEHYQCATCGRIGTRPAVTDAHARRATVDDDARGAP